MSTPTSSSSESAAAFDEYAAQYDAALARGLAVSGESKEYFARGRVAWLERRLRELAPELFRGQKQNTVLDFGCGVGSATPFLMEFLPIQNVLGIDVSTASLAVARREYSHGSARFMAHGEYVPRGECALAFCNGVFHHIPLQERANAAHTIYEALSPGGWFAFWENNPWNIGTRIVMQRCEFDRDAITLSPPQARQLLQSAGFEIVETNFLFWFPRVLRALRPLEPRMARWPLGAQYQVLCRKHL
jgi:trans-aconitate methyltransferase